MGKLSIYWATIHRYVSWPEGRKGIAKAARNNNLKQQQTGHDRMINRLFCRASNSWKTSVGASRYQIEVAFLQGFAKGFGVPWAKLQRFQINCTPDIISYIHWTSPNQGWECESRSICIETTTLLWHSSTACMDWRLQILIKSRHPPHHHMYMYVYTVSTNIMKCRHAHIDTYIHSFIHTYIYIYTYAQI